MPRLSGDTAMEYLLRAGALAAMYILWIIGLAFESRATPLSVLQFTTIALLCTRMVYFFWPQNPTADYSLSMAAMFILFMASDSVLLRKYQPPLWKIG